MLRSRRGFTLVELLVVIGIIVLLIAISMPFVGRAWEAANQTRCKANLKALSTAFFQFAADHDKRLPGSRRSAWADQDPTHFDWLFGKYSVWDIYYPDDPVQLNLRLSCAPQWGTIWTYISNQPPPVDGQFYNANPGALSIYRCPSMRPEKPGCGLGSNGRFDYYAFACFCGAPIKDIAPMSRLAFPMNPNDGTLQHDATPFMGWDEGNGYSAKFEENHPTPIIAQEDAQYSSNWLMDTWGEYFREMTHVHNGGSFYAAIDGAVYWVNEPDTDLPNLYYEGCRLWSSTGPRSGQPVRMDSDYGWIGTTTPVSGWGQWSHQ